ncbi:MAG: S41 family peptidase [Prevotella sp.]|nr:S41 family peptidase [Prevotella sp.]MCM1074818.1 S41 family peptidase [Ruminococcus sp.]
MNKAIQYICILLISSIFPACASLEDYDNSAADNFECLWRTIDEHYCFFEEKGIDWNEVHDRYYPQAAQCETAGELFDVCSAMLDELKDGHVNLISTSRTSYYKKWWTDYPQDFNLRTIQQYYLNFDYRQTSGITYQKIAGGKIGYIYYSSFSYRPGEGTLDGIFSYFNDCESLIIDIRNNGGGLLTAVDTWVGRFISREIVGGYIRHKTGPGHNDFSEPYPVKYKPAEAGRVMWTKPIVVLTNRACFSSANDFVSVIKQLPQVTVVGARTGGGGGMPFSSETPCGWSVRFSACPVTDAQGNEIESGIDPSPGHEVHAPDSQLAQGTDAILDHAVLFLLGNMKQ